MTDSFTEFSSMSWFGRIAESIKGIFIGMVLFVIGIGLLFWNEGRAVQTAKSLAEGAKATAEVSAERVDRGNDMKLIHFSAVANTDAMLTDSLFAVSENALKLRRVVQIYQWKEYKESHSNKTLGGGQETRTTYTYDKVWDDERAVAAL